MIGFQRLAGRRTPSWAKFMNLAPGLDIGYLDLRLLLSDLGNCSVKLVENVAWQVLRGFST